MLHKLRAIIKLILAKQYVVVTDQVMDKAQPNPFIKTIVDAYDRAQKKGEKNADNRLGERGYKNRLSGEYIQGNDN